MGFSKVLRPTDPHPSWRCISFPHVGRTVSFSAQNPIVLVPVGMAGDVKSELALSLVKAERRSAVGDNKDLEKNVGAKHYEPDSVTGSAPGVRRLVSTILYGNSESVVDDSEENINKLDPGDIEKLARHISIDGLDLLHRKMAWIRKRR